MDDFTISFRSYRFISHIADVAFVDRADIKAYVGPPTLQARYEILRSCLQELMRTGILSSLQVQSVIIFAQETFFPR